MLSTKHHSHPRAVFLTALPVEFDAVKCHLESFRREPVAGTVYHKGYFKNTRGVVWDVFVKEVGKGNAAAAAQAERAALQLRPQLMFFVGIAGGLKDVRLGDVVAADFIIGYESGADGMEFRSRRDIGRCCPSLVELARAERSDSNWLARLKDTRWLRRLNSKRLEDRPRVHVAPLAAGEKVVKSKRSATCKLLRKHCSDAIAVEMEGRGFLEAMWMNSAIGAMVIRGVSDLLGQKAKTDANGWQELASISAAAFAFELLGQHEVVILEDSLRPFSITVRGDSETQLTQLITQLTNAVPGRIVIDSIVIGDQSTGNADL